MSNSPEVRKAITEVMEELSEMSSKDFRNLIDNQITESDNVTLDINSAEFLRLT